MRFYQKSLTASRLREVIHYDALSGAMTWRAKTNARSTTIQIGAKVGWVNTQGYLQVRIDGICYLLSRLAVLYVTGEWPADEVDHKDLNPLNNAWSNLRAARRGNQTANTRRRKDNTSGKKGVQLVRGKYRALINHEGKCHHLGYFSTFTAAVHAREAAEKRYHGEFARSL